VKLVDLTSDKVNPNISSGRATHSVEFFKANGIRVAFAKQEIRIADLLRRRLARRAVWCVGDQRACAHQGSLTGSCASILRDRGDVMHTSTFHVATPSTAISSVAHTSSFTAAP
jgi:hypothetical protein